MKTTKFILAIALINILISCNPKKGKKENVNSEKGTFGYDLQFLQSKDSVIVLTNGDSKVIVSPKYQGKVFTSTANGLSGNSFGWINYAALSSDTLAKHINAYGGEDRMWLGPEGGQFSIFFKPRVEMKFENWQTPAGLDTEAWNLLKHDSSSVTMSKVLQLNNYSGTKFNASLCRTVRLLSINDLRQKLGVEIKSGIKWVGFESENVLTNTGAEKWTKEKGALCVWVLGMLKPSESGTVVIPYVQGNEKELGKIATTNYFGEIPNDRIKMKNGLLYFKIDGKFRSKIGLTAKRTTSVAGSYDATNNVLTIIKFNKPNATTDYINQLWEIQKEPFKGDAINSYNDGPLEDGTQMGPFYELETSSPAAFLTPGESITHTQQIYHFSGSEKELTSIAEKVLKVSIMDIKKA